MQALEPANLTYAEILEAIKDSATRRKLPALLSPEQAGSLVNVSADTIKVACDNGQIGAIDTNVAGAYRKWRVTAASLAAWVANKGAMPSGGAA